MAGMPAMQEQLQAMAMERMAPMPCGFHPWMVGMPAMQEQLPAMPWMDGMPTTQEQLSAMPWMDGMPAMQEQLQAMTMHGQGNDEHVPSVRNMLKQDCLAP